MKHFPYYRIGKHIFAIPLMALGIGFLPGYTSENIEPLSITLIGTADLQGEMKAFRQPYEINGTQRQLMGGGIARIATVLKRATMENPESTFVLSSGDDLMGRYFHTFQGRAIYDLMSQSGYMLYAPGNHEFDKGTEVFAKALEHSRFETLCSDLLTTGTPLEKRCSPYAVRETKGLKIGFFSLMTETFPLITTPGKVKLKADNLTSARKMVKQLHDKGCHVIVAITHVGLARDREIARRVKGIDVIFGGHSHKATRRVIREGETLIINGGEEGSYIGKLVLPFNRQKALAKEHAHYTLIPVIASIPPDKKVAARLKSYATQLPATTVLGETTVSWNLETDALRRGESRVANMINDLLREKFSVDIVMNNAGAFRGKKVYPPGKITDTMLHEIDAFSNHVYMMDIRGKYLRQILEHSAALYGRGGLMQVSGIRYSIDLAKRAQKLKRHSDGRWEIVTRGRRVRDIAVADRNGTFSPLDEKRSYRILSNAYLVKHAGDGYFWFGTYGTRPVNTYTTLYSIMATYLEKHKTLNPKPLDGRLKVFP